MEYKRGRPSASRTSEFVKTKITALKEFWAEYKRYKIGLAGLVILFILIGMAIAANIVVPQDIREHWATNPRWAFNPKEAPPAWVNMFSKTKYLEPTNLTLISMDEFWKLCLNKSIARYKEELKKYSPEKQKLIIEHLKKVCKQRKGYYYVFEFYNHWDEVGKDAMVIIENIQFNAIITMDIYRPDGINITDIELARLTPINSTYIKLQFHKGLAERIVEALVKPIDGEDAARSLSQKFRIKAVSTIPFIFAIAEPGISNLATGTLKGQYRLVIGIEAQDTKVKLEELPVPRVAFKMLGACYGLLGTDGNGRDNFITILLGSQLALLLGFSYSVAAVIVGVIYGALSGYLRGSGRIWADEILQRINEVIYSLPVLPFLIIFSYYLRMVYKIQPNIWHIAGLLLIFGWTGVAIVTRSMALSIMGQPYIESAIAVGASGRRILFRYVLPQLVPYAFAAIALSIPGAILMEAGLSFLGLTDPNMPSWGRMLNEAQGAIYAWWWVIPPGLMITVTAVAFAFIGTALDTIVNPKLRRA